MKYHQSIIFLMTAIFMISCNTGNNENEYTGVIEGTVVKVPALTGGQIISLLVDVGNRVDPGQVLALVDTTELGLQRRQLTASLDEIGVQSRIAETNVARTSDELRYVQTKFDRISGLYNAESVPLQNYDDVKNQLDQVNKALLTARQQQQSLSARKEVVRAQIALLDKKISDATIRSPRSGIISAKYFEAGEAIPPGQPVLELTDISKVDARIYVAEPLLASLKHGQPVDVQIDGSDQQLTGQLSWISPKAEFTPKSIMTPETRTTLVYAVEVSIENPDDLLKHGMPVVIKLQDSK